MYVEVPGFTFSVYIMMHIIGYHVRFANAIDLLPLSVLFNELAHTNCA